MDLQKHRLVLAVVEALNQVGSWTGKTHIQKTFALLLARGKLKVPFTIVLYKHGPYSFELRDTIDLMRSYDALSFSLVTGGYGEKVEPGRNREFIEGRTEFPENEREEIEFVCDFVKNRNVAALERYATAAWIHRQEEIDDPVAIAARLHQLKPHIPEEEASAAAEEVLQLL